MSTTVQKWGNSLGVRIPKAVAEQVDLKVGTEVRFETAADTLTIRPVRRRRRRGRYTLKQLLARAKGRNPHGEIDWGTPVGREIW